MDGQVIRQSSSYRQGLVLGLTMAEIMILLVFCLLIALATLWKLEKNSKDTTDSRDVTEYAQREENRGLLEWASRQSDLLEILKQARDEKGSGAVSEYWRQLADGRSVASDAAKNNVSMAEIKEFISKAASSRTKGAASTPSRRDTEIVESIEKVMPNVRGPSVTPAQVGEIVKRGLSAQSTTGHQWPPIISLSDAGGYHFKSGSAELSLEFRNDLSGPILARILDLVKQYDVDVIEVVGHTDGQPVGARLSNLDRDLLPVLKGTANIASVVPADNAGLGLARAVSVISVLLQNDALSRYKVLPLSGAQLTNNDETLATSGVPADIRERRRIEIRLRKSTPYDSSVKASTAPLVPDVRPPRPRPRPPTPPAAAQTPPQPLNIRPGPRPEVFRD
jgi:flagellar motor protein MotB